MTDTPRTDRRSFLLRLSRTAVYSSPIVHTLVAPRSVQGQGLSGKGKGMDMDVFTPVAPAAPVDRRLPTRSLPSAPWARHPGDGDD